MQATPKLAESRFIGRKGFRKEQPNYNTDSCKTSEVGSTRHRSPSSLPCKTGGGHMAFCMTEVSPNELKQAVERMHDCSAVFVQSVPIRERFKRRMVWEGVVNVFELIGHPTATQAYAWSSPIEGSDKRRFFAVLHLPPIGSPVEAVRAAIVAEARNQK
jgi:hypothetical protein